MTNELKNTKIIVLSYPVHDDYYRDLSIALSKLIPRGIMSNRLFELLATWHTRYVDSCGTVKKQILLTKSKTIANDDNIKTSLLNQSTKSIKSTKSTKSIKSTKSTKSIKSIKSTNSTNSIDSSLYTFVNPKNTNLDKLSTTTNDDFIIVSAERLHDNLRHTNPRINDVLHEISCCIFSRKTYEPICVVYRCMIHHQCDTKLQNINNCGVNTSYVVSRIHNILNMYTYKEFDQNRIIIRKRYIGSFIILFNHNDKWWFLLHKCIYIFSKENHPILYEHLREGIDNFDKTLCYHLVLVDNRTRNIIMPYNEYNRVILIGLTSKTTLKEIDMPTDDIIYNVLYVDQRIYLSCLDELLLRLEELDMINKKNKRLMNRGYIVALYNEEKTEKIIVGYDTMMYMQLMTNIPSGLNMHGVHLFLYQKDLLSSFLQFTSDANVDIVKRINNTISTMSREILDIYHATRKKQNGDLYKILSSSYKKIIYSLHSGYIDQKNDTNDNKSSTSEYIEFDTFDQKVAVTVDNVYTKLKSIDIMELINLYADREILLTELSKYPTILNQMKRCTNTLIQCKLLKITNNVNI